MNLDVWNPYVLSAVLLTIIIGYGLWLNTYFKRKGVKCIDGALPFLGHFLKIFLGTEHFIELVYKSYYSCDDQKYIGLYAFRSPIIILKDLELIKQIGVRDFDQFVDHRVFMDEDSDPLFGRNLFFLRGKRWKEMRNSMSPAYTGSKMRNMFPMIVECAEQSIVYFKKQAEKSPAKDAGYIEVELKDVATRFTSDAIASTAFGIKTDSLEHPDNEFYKMGKSATNFSGIQFLKFLGYGSFPSIMKFFKVKLFTRSVRTFFTDLVHKTMVTREQNGVSRPDMINLLMMVKKGSLKYESDIAKLENTGFATIQQTILKQDTVKTDWKDDDLTAQAMAFLLAGFDTSSSLICFTCYELALNPDIQKRLQEEIDDVLSRTESSLSYNDLINMKYIDMVVSESLRKWPPDGHLDRICANTYTLPPPNEKSNQNYHLYKGHDVWIPTYSLHHDPKYHPNPDKFDPERFSDENKDNIQPFTFIPFGVGPRFCIGARFAVLESKIILFHLLAHFNVVVTEKTSIPINLARDTFIMHNEGGFWLGLQPRKSSA